MSDVQYQGVSPAPRAQCYSCHQLSMPQSVQRVLLARAVREVAAAALGGQCSQAQVAKVPAAHRAAHVVVVVLLVRLRPTVWTSAHAQ